MNKMRTLALGPQMVEGRGRPVRNHKNEEKVSWTVTMKRRRGVGSTEKLSTKGWELWGS